MGQPEGGATLSRNVTKTITLALNLTLPRTVTLTLALPTVPCAGGEVGEVEWDSDKNKKARWQ